MNTHFRPVHCGFETLRVAARMPAKSAYRRFQIATNEQLTARSYADSRRPDVLFSDFIER